MKDKTIGIIGHVDHGKKTIKEAIEEVLAKEKVKKPVNDNWIYNGKSLINLKENYKIKLKQQSIIFNLRKIWLNSFDLISEKDGKVIIIEHNASKKDLEKLVEEINPLILEDKDGKK